jgi:hypothetical protein
VGLALVALVVGGCKRETKTVFQKIEVDAEELLKEPALGWFPGELNGRIAGALGAHALPVLKEGESAPSGAHVLKGRLSLESEVTEARQATAGEVAVAAVLQMKGKELGALDSVSAHREVPLKGSGPEDRREATVHAIEGVLEDIAAEAGALVKATQQKDEALVKALASPDARTHTWAMKVLADRKHPAAVPPLLELLKSEDLDVVRTAIGALVELKDPRAVPMMIDSSHARDNLFQREVVFALGAIGGDEAEAYLFTMAQGHDEPVIRASAQQALDEMKARSKQGDRK